MRVVELDPRVVTTAAHTHFALPADGERLAVEIGDGAEALSPECCDVLVVDAYADEAHVPEFAAAEFYDAAFLALGARGVLVVNFMDDDPRLDQYMQRLESAFGGAVARCARCTTRTSPLRPQGPARRGSSGRSCAARAGRLEARLGLPFTKLRRPAALDEPHRGPSLILRRLLELRAGRRAAGAIAFSGALMFGLTASARRSSRSRSRATSCRSRSRSRSSRSPTS